MIASYHCPSGKDDQLELMSALVIDINAQEVIVIDIDEIVSRF